MKSINNKQYKEAKILALTTNEKLTDSALFIRTHDVFGRYINSANLEYSLNQTYINNIQLINDRKAATNCLDKYIFYNLYIVSNDKVNDFDWVYDKGNNRVIQLQISKDTNISNYVKVIASNDPQLKNLPIINNDFINEYVNEYNQNNKLETVLVKYEKGLNGERCNMEFFERPTINKKDNSITIKRIKENYSKEEVKDLILKFATKVFSEKFEILDINNWIEENL
jgi:hypothetical protein